VGRKVNFLPVEVSSEKKPSMVGGGTIEIELAGRVPRKAASMSCCHGPISHRPS
jgi:hypothetical protein